MNSQIIKDDSSGYHKWSDYRASSTILGIFPKTASTNCMNTSCETYLCHAFKQAYVGTGLKILRFYISEILRRKVYPCTLVLPIGFQRTGFRNKKKSVTVILPTAGQCCFLTYSQNFNCSLENGPLPSLKKHHSIG